MTVRASRQAHEIRELAAALVCDQIVCFIMRTGDIEFSSALKKTET